MNMIKKNGKIISAFVFALSLIFVGCQSAYNYDVELDDDIEMSSRAVTSTVTLSTAPALYDLVGEGYNEGEKGPIILTKGTLVNGWTSKTVYLVTLSGTEFVDNQATGYLTDLLSGFNLDNAYVRNVVSVIENNIPKNSNIVLAGHSLGGMICQQVAANDDIKKYYNVLNTVTFGSPLLSAGSREGTTRRLGDTSDVIPYMSGSLFNNTLRAIAGLQRESGGYGLNWEKAHVESYSRTDVWGKYDVLGSKGGKAYLKLNVSTKTFYKSPVIAW